MERVLKIIKPGRNVRRILLFVLAAIIALTTLYSGTVTVSADPWTESTGGIYSEDGSSANLDGIGENQDDWIGEEDANPESQNWFVTLIGGIITGVATGLMAILSAMNASIDQLIFGRVMGMADVAYFTFELKDGNVFGFIGGLVYDTLRGAVYVMMTIFIMKRVNGAAWKTGRGVAYLAYKDVLMDSAIVFLLLALMPNIVDLVLYVRDTLLYLVVNAVYGSDVFGGASSIIKTFYDLCIDGGSFSLLNCLMFLALVAFNCVLAFVYLGIALNMTILFIEFPFVALKSLVDKQALNQWIMLLLGCIATPILDAVLISIPTLLGVLTNVHNTLKIPAVSLALMQIGCCYMIFPARSMAKQAIGLVMGIGEMAGQNIGSQLVGKGLNAIKNKAKKSVENALENSADKKAADHYDQQASIDKEEQAAKMAEQQRRTAGENVGVGNVKEGPFGKEGSGAMEKVETGTDIANAMKSSLEMENEALKSEGAGLTGDAANKVSANEEAIKDLENQIAQTPQTAAEKYADAVKAEQEANARKPELMAEREKNFKDLGDAYHERNKNDGNIFNNKQEIERLENQNSELQKRLDSGDISEKERESIQGQVNSNNQRIQKLQEENENAEKSNVNLDKDISRLESNIAANDQELKALNQTTAERMTAADNYNRVMQTARDMQGAAVERRASLMNEDAQNTAKLQKMCGTQDVSAVLNAASASQEVERCQVAYERAVSQGMDASVIEQRQQELSNAQTNYQTASDGYSAEQIGMAQKVLSGRTQIGQINSDLQQLSMAINEATPQWMPVDGSTAEQYTNYSGNASGVMSGSSVSGQQMLDMMNNLGIADNYMQQRQALNMRYANVSNFENPDVFSHLSNEQKADFYRQRVQMRRERAVWEAAGGVVGAIAGLGTNMMMDIPYGVSGTFDTASFGSEMSGVAGEVSAISRLSQRFDGYTPGQLPTGLNLTANSFSSYRTQGMDYTDRYNDMHNIAQTVDDFRMYQDYNSAISPFVLEANKRAAVVAQEVMGKYPQVNCSNESMISNMELEFKHAMMNDEGLRDVYDSVLQRLAINENNQYYSSDFVKELDANVRDAICKKYIDELKLAYFMQQENI